MSREELIQTILERYERLLLDLKNNKIAGVDETPAAPDDTNSKVLPNNRGDTIF